MLEKKCIRLWTVCKSMVTKVARWFSWPWTDSKQKPTKLVTKVHCTYTSRFSPRLWNILHSGCHLQVFAFWEKRQKLIFPREEAIASQMRTRKQHICMTGKSCEPVLEVRVWKFLTHQVQPPTPTPESSYHPSKETANSVTAGSCCVHLRPTWTPTT